MYALTYSYSEYSVVSTIISLVGIAFLFYKLLLPALNERRKGQRLLQEIDGPPPHWLFGHLRNGLRPTQEGMDEMCEVSQKFPKIWSAWFGPFISYIVLQHPHVLKPILSISACVGNFFELTRFLPCDSEKMPTHVVKFRTRFSFPERKDNFGYRFLKPWLGEGLLISSGMKWQRNRHLLTSAFHFDILKHYVKVFNSCTTTLLTKWSVINNNKPTEIFEPVSLMTFDSMLQCAMSCKTNCQNVGSENRYISAVYTLTTIAMKRLFNPLMHNDFLFNLSSNGRKFKEACDYVHQYDEKVIRERKAVLHEMLKNNCNDQSDASDISNLGTSDIQRLTSIRLQTGKYLDFLDILLLTRDEDGHGLTDREVRDEVDTFLFEGHDTTASGISWSFYCLATNPDYQELCREEVKRVMGDRQEVSWNDLSKFSYLTMFIKEVLRLYPPVFTITRKLSRPLTFDRGFGDDQHCLDDKSQAESRSSKKVLESSTNLAILLHVIHRNEAMWENPEVFDPSRFTKENIASRSNFAYLPFSAGPRNCIGQNFAMAEMKIVLARALAGFRFYVTEDCPKAEMSPRIVLKSVNGINVIVEKLS